MFSEPIFLILLVIFVALWTARTARNRGRNPLVWGGVALIPVIQPLWALMNGGEPNGVTALSMLPMLALVFIPSRRTAADAEQQDNVANCPRCQHAHESGPSFCTNCGWELAKPYASADATTAAASTASPADATLSTAATAAETSRDDAAAAPIPEPTLASTPTETPPAEVADTPAAGMPAAAPAQAPAAVPSGFSAEPLTISQPLTAAAMTERGLSLFNQGRVREAVDQFTKAIALDPRYREAWSSRAKAYTDLGLSDKAAADRQQLEAI